MALSTRSATAGHAIPTTYRGTRFRSRLEARWAAFFDLIEWAWIYEPFDTGDWIPDFLIRGARPFLVEIGPGEHHSDYSEKAAKPLAAYPPLPAYCERIAHDECWHDDDYIISYAPERITLVLGLLPTVTTTFGEAAGLLTDDGGGAGVEPAMWGRCPTCVSAGGLGICVTHALGDYTHFPCGHWHDNRVQDDALDGALIALWNRASSPVQWRGSARRA